MSNHLCREIPSRLTTLFGYESDRLVYIRPQVQAFSRLVCWLLLYRNLGILGTNLLSCGGTPGKIAETARSDEIGQLAAAIERMGASIRLAMERLRKCA